MGKKLWVRLLLLLVVPGFLFTVSCAQKEIKTDTVTLEEQQAEAARQAALEKARAEELERQRAIEEAQLREAQLREEEARAQEIAAAREMFMNEDIHFAFDKSVLTPTAQEILKKKAEWLRNNPDNTVVIEGHCDERGTTEYNIALGERRALAAKVFLTDLGIDSSRLSTISYGEERPVDPSHNEEAWAKNRRAHFVIE